MPSNNKTPRLKLNQWIGSDKPKRADWNTDNVRIDEGVGLLEETLNTHQNSLLHLTEEERKRWNKNKSFETFVYTGNRTAVRSLDLNATPLFGIVFALEKPFLSHKESIDSYAGFISAFGCSQGLSLKEKGFLVKQEAQTSSDNLRACFNELNQKYICIYWV